MMSLYRRAKAALQIADVRNFNMNFMETLFQCFELGTKKTMILALKLGGCNIIGVC